jgi:hypothetical protein
MGPRQVVPLSQRRGDILIVAFFLLNLCFITYIVDFEQLVIPDPTHFVYPAWPPPAMVDLVHWWGHTFDPLLMARPVWWKVTILFDAVFFGPFYACAVYAYLKGKEWIRLLSIVWASMLFTVTTIIVFEEIYGPYRSPQLPIVLLANAPWILMPIFVVYRMGRSPHPFTRAVTVGEELEPTPATARLNPHQV